MDRISPLTSGPNHHFFGYYGVNPWNVSGTAHLCLRTDFQDHAPIPEDQAEVGWADARTGAFTSLTRTAAFNFQQGAMLNWIDAGFGEEFVHNDWDGLRLVARAVDPVTGKRRTIDGAIEAVSPDGAWAIGLDFARMARCRTVVGYANRHYPQTIEPHPEEDGLFRLDLRTGESRLILSVADVMRANPMPQIKDGPAWLDHVVINPSGTRLFFFCRIKTQKSWHSSFWTVNPDGSDLRCQVDYRYWISHFAWKDDWTMLLTTNVLGQSGFVEFTDNVADFRPLGLGILPADGHACYSPNRRWIVSDCYQERSGDKGPERFATLFLFHPDSGRRVDLAEVIQPRPFRGDIRCDLHPRWSGSGKTVSFDSVHGEGRQIYLAEVDDLMERDG